MKRLITVIKRSDDWHASSIQYPKMWESGKTMNEAIGKLLISMNLVDIK